MSRRDLMRQQLAHQAARLMAEDGIGDFAAAKRKAARQLGAAETQHLPSNQEVETALRSFQGLYQRDHQPQVLRQLRQQALEAMRQLAPFHPYLTGSVLTGTAGVHSDINLVLFSDDEKAVLLYLLRHELDFDSGEWRGQLAGRQRTFPSFTLHSETGVPLHLVVLPANAQHSSGRKTETHGDAEAVAALLAAAEHFEAP